jgi:hypothetical protein
VSSEVRLSRFSISFSVTSSPQAQVTLILVVDIKFAFVNDTLTQCSGAIDDQTMRSKTVLQTIGKTFGIAMAGMCLVSSLAIAQTPTQTPPQRPPQKMTCSKVDGKGDCVAATTADGKEIVVVGEGVKAGEAMICVDLGNVVDCKPATK